MATHPIALPEAFSDNSVEGHQSQAALLLFLGVFVHRKQHTADGFVTKKTPLPWADLGIEEDYRKLGIPKQILNLQKTRTMKSSLSKLNIQQMGTTSESTNSEEWSGVPEGIENEIGELQRQLILMWTQTSATHYFIYSLSL